MWGEQAAFRAVLLGGADGAMREAVELAGGAVAAEQDWGEASEPDANTILILDTAGAPVPDDLELLAALADVVSCDLDQVDVVAAALLLTDAQFLCAPTMAERIAGIAVAAGLKGADAAPALREGETARLQRLQAELARIAAALARLAADEGGVADRRPTFDAGPTAPASASAPAPDPQTIRGAIRARRLRDGFFGDGLFEEPAWDMLLDLYAAALEGRRVSVSSLCIAAAVAPTTALRWLGRLEAERLVERRPDPADRRRAFVALAPGGAGAMQGYLAALARAGLSLG